MPRADWFLGLMTGTSLDGMIDAALLRTNGEEVFRHGAFSSTPYPADVRELVSAAQRAALGWRFQGAEPPVFAEAERALTIAQSDAAARLLAESDVDPAAVRAVGFHGQTVLHRAPAPGHPGATRQLGDGALMADRLRIDVVWDFRSADVRAGGQGAPLVPVYHAALLRALPGAGRPEAILNLGGVGNVSWWNGDDDLVAFDTGPANGPLNDWMMRHGLGDMDRDGTLAASGQVDEERLRALCAHPFLRALPPKSLDRADFTAAMSDGLSPADGAALLTAFPAACVALGLSVLPEPPRRLVVCGGGRRNPTMMRELSARTALPVLPAEHVGWRGDAVEAECFAFLAARVLRGLPLSFPGTTGVPVPTPGGRVSRPTSSRAGGA
ncbi:anhydro-N-acetylmuramic acid kinase [Rhizosaccharibacter radicis]|uniref:Anhydro-N-acetylmuramic acid kinase n=1 Tax=Rhizosaccharibacter radicis TaxID=2782605 RepID=A0ABT1VXT3_9PROT|nr:anhydro-N-acetylmuramic acid kinase [Acetobacteraceae bacterium KSS12]